MKQNVGAPNTTIALSSVAPAGLTAEVAALAGVVLGKAVGFEELQGRGGSW